MAERMKLANKGRQDEKSSGPKEAKRKWLENNEKLCHLKVERERVQNYTEGEHRYWTSLYATDTRAEASTCSFTLLLSAGTVLL